MPTGATLVVAFLSKHGIEGAVRRMPASTRTAADAAAAIGCDVAQIAKSVFFSAIGSDRLVLVVASGPHRISTDKVSSLVGEPVQLAPAQLVKKRTGYVVGGVPPVAHSGEHAVLIDPHLMKFETVWAAAGAGDCVFAIKPVDLQRLTGGAVVDVTIDT